MSKAAALAETRQRVDVWLWRARFVKTRAAASRLVSEGGVRLARDGASRHLDKPSAELAVGDALTIPLERGLRTVQVRALAGRRGPPAEARTLYSDIGAQD